MTDSLHGKICVLTLAQHQTHITHNAVTFDTKITVKVSFSNCPTTWMLTLWVRSVLFPAAWTEWKQNQDKKSSQMLHGLYWKNNQNNWQQFCISSTETLPTKSFVLKKKHCDNPSALCIHPYNFQSWLQTSIKRTVQESVATLLFEANSSRGDPAPQM